MSENVIMMLTTSPNKATRLVSDCESTSGLLFVIESWNYLNILIISFLVVYLINMFFYKLEKNLHLQIGN